MGFYAKHVAPRLIDKLCGVAGMARYRENTCAGLTGTVLEVGFGSGNNIGYYPPAVTKILAVEPALTATKLAQKKLRGANVTVEMVGLRGESIDLEDNSCDAALVTFVLCSVQDPQKVLSEIYRVLKPGGEFHFLEHGLAPDAKVAKWQRRIDPFEFSIADGCLLTREPLKMFNDTAFEMVSSKERFTKGPKPWSYFTTGVARKPAS